MNISHWFLGLVLLFYTSSAINGQNWTCTASSHIQNNRIEVSCIDNMNNIYCISDYPDSLFVGDTAFIHTGHMYSDNIGLLIYDKDGNFIKAIDFHTIPQNPIMGFFVQVDDNQNIFVACEFRKRIFLLDTVINHGSGPNIDSPEIAIIKITKQGNVDWAKVISSTSQDVCHGFKKTSDGNFYLMVEHYQSGVVNYMNQDTVEYDNSPKVLIKMTDEGEILWRRSFTRLQESIECRNFFVDADDNAFACGYTREGGIVMDEDTILVPDSYISTLPNFIIGYDKDGQTIHAGILDCELLFTRILAIPDGELFFTAKVWTDSTLFGTDMLYRGEDSTTRLIGRMTKNYEPVWYHSVETKDWILPYSFQIDYKNDTLYAAIQGTRIHEFAGIEYDLGLRQSTLFVPFDVDGISGIGRILKAEYQRYPSSLFIDHCDNLLMGGGYRGEGWFGDDTIVSYRPQQSDGFLSKFNFGKHQSFSIGKDTVIASSHSITLAAPPDFESYKWSNGADGQIISITGTDFDPGVHEIWCIAANGYCIFSDTLILEVIDDTWIEESKLMNLTLSPNPTYGQTTIHHNLQSTKNLQIKVFNINGNQIEILNVNKAQNTKQVVLDATDYSPGIYFIQLNTGEQVATGKLLLIK